MGKQRVGRTYPRKGEKGSDLKSNTTEVSKEELSSQDRERT